MVAYNSTTNCREKALIDISLCDFKSMPFVMRKYRMKAFTLYLSITKGILLKSHNEISIRTLENKPIH